MEKYFNSIEQMCEELARGGEIEFTYKDKKYSITHVEDKICIMEFYNYKSEAQYQNVCDIRRYDIEGKTLEDIFCDIEIQFSSF